MSGSCIDLANHSVLRRRRVIQGRNGRGVRAICWVGQRAGLGRLGSEMPGVRAPRGWRRARHPPRLQARVPRQNPLVRAAATHRRQPRAAAVLKRLPAPPWLCLARHDRPPRIACSCSRTLDDAFHRTGRQEVEPWRVHGAQCGRFCCRAVMPVVGRIFHTRAVSRMPLPVRALSSMCAVTAGDRPWEGRSRCKEAWAPAAWWHLARCVPALVVPPWRPGSL